MSFIFAKNNNSSGGANQTPVEFTVDGAGAHDPASGQPNYNNPAIVGKLFSFFLSGQYQDTTTWSRTATGIALIGANFQPGQTGSIIFY